MPERAPYPLEEAMQRLFEPGGSAACSSLPRTVYLNLAAVIVDRAQAEWLDADGRILEPYDAGEPCPGTAARFACPAAILARHRGRGDLLESASRALDHLSDRIAQGNREGRTPFNPGAFDLFAKEILVAVEQLDGLAQPDRLARWRAALADIVPETAYTPDRNVREGKRFHNFAVYASVGEWLRCRLGLDDRRDWMERFLGMALLWMTPHGLYRDPGDPSVYDLSVRQNLSELLSCGYDGPCRAEFEELLRRGGLTMLLMLSPLGWTPPGGRSNLFVHNEAMGAYIAEFEARRWQTLRRPEIAGAFKSAAAGMARAARPFLLDMQPPRIIKNRFHPSTRHGRDAHYGWYAVYGLLAASLFARAYLISDDAIPPAPAGSRGAFLHLFPEFHRTFAACGDTQVVSDTRGQPGYDATGVVRFHRSGVPSALGLSLGIAAEPHHIVSAGSADRAAAVAPAWRAAQGPWESLAPCSDQIMDVRCESERVGDDDVRWTFVHILEGCRARRVTQRFTLRPGELTIAADVEGDVDEVALEIPCLVSDGESAAETRVGATGAEVRFRGARLTVSTRGAAHIGLGETITANREALYRILTCAFSGKSFQAALALIPA